MSKKICGTNWLIQIFFCLQIASLCSPQRVLCFRMYSALDFLDLALAKPAKICLDYKRKHNIKNSDYLLIE